MAIFYYELAKSSIERLKLVRDYDFVYTTLFELYADQGADNYQVKPGLEG